MQKSKKLLHQLSRKVSKPFGILLMHAGVMKRTHTLSCPFDIQGREPCLCDFVWKKITLACIQTFTDFFQIWHDDRHHKALYFDFSLGEHLHSRSQLYEKSKTFDSIALQLHVSNWKKFSMSLYGLLIMLNLFYLSNIQGRELFLTWFYEI